MFRIPFTLLVIFSCLNSNAQQLTPTPANPIPDANCGSIEMMSAYLKQYYPTDTARVRAIYDWVTTHISYDVARFNARDKNKEEGSPVPGATEALASRRAVCQGYSDLFVALCTGTGIEAERIGGYSKILGKVSETGHAWVAAKLQGEWYFFDPTWGAGIVKDDVFVKRYTTRFYKVQPIKFVEDHMPCDPMYQLLTYPLSHAEFVAGKPAATKTIFNYKDSLRIYNQLTPVAKAETELRRMLAAGVSNGLLRERVNMLQKNVNGAASKDAFDEAQKTYKHSFTLYKSFMDLKRTQFANTPDADLRTRVDSIEYYIKQSRSTLQEANPKSDAQREAKANFTAAIDKFWTTIVKEKDFVMKFISTDKEKRKQLFMR